MTPERWQQTTRLLCVAVPVLLLAYSLAARAGGGADATISRVVADAARRWPEVAFFAGLLAGHWFWSNR